MIPIFLCLLFIVTGCGPPLQIDRPRQNSLQSQNRTEENWFKIIVLDVGQGDAVLLISPDSKAALIDTGPREIGDRAVLKVLEEQDIPTLQNIFISHHHEDHFGGLEKIMDALAIAPSKIIDANNAQVGQTLSLGPVRIQIEAGNGQIGEVFVIPDEQRGDENNLSLALLIAYKNFRYFTSGDLPGGGGNPPYVTIDLESSLAPLVGDVDVLLVPHHGSHTSTNETFLNTLKPEAVIISTGNDNEFYHPHPSVIERLKESGAKIYQTEQGWLSETGGIEIMNGHICIITDGKTYLVKPYALDKCSSFPSLSN